MLNVFRKFKLLSKEKRSMLALFWVYEFVNTTVGVFLSVFVFLQTGSLSFLALFILTQFTGAFLGFVIFGYVVAQNKYSMKWNYLRAFSVYFLGFIILSLMPHTEKFLLLFSFINGLGLGIFWLGNHTYEMLYTKNEDGDRDFYSSMVQGGTQLISISGPLIGTFLVFLSERVFDTEALKLLFIFLPFVYLASLPFLFKLPHFVPPWISRSDIKSFFTDKKYKRMTQYYFFTGTKELLGVSVTFFSIVALKTIINIGVWQTTIGVIAFFTTILLANVRYEGNRLRIMLFAVIGILITTSLLVFSNISVYFYIIASLLLVVLKPVYRVSEHATDLRSMDFLAREKGSFYPGVLYRDAILYFSRFLFLGALFVFAGFFKNDLFSARIAVLVYSIIFLLNWFVARRMIKENSN